MWISCDSQQMWCGCAEPLILTCRYGLRGFYERDAKPVVLTPEIVDGIHLKGGTILVGMKAGQVYPDCFDLLQLLHLLIWIKLADTARAPCLAHNASCNLASLHIVLGN